MAAPPAKSQDAVVLINRFFANEQGRDKFNKVIQYGSRYMAYHLLTQDPKSDWGKRFKVMFAFTRDCRKILRLFKWVGEYEKLEKLLASPSSHKQQLAIISTIGMAAYWFFDNMTYLVKGGFIADNPNYARLSMLGWNVGITGAMIADTQQLMDNLERERALRSALGLPDAGLLDVEAMREGKPLMSAPGAGGVEGEEAARMRREIVALYSARQNLLLSFIKNGGDWLISANGSGMIENVLGYALNDGVMGVAGTVSGLAVMVQVYRGL